MYIEVIVMALLAYLVGSIPFGVMVGRYTGVDPRLAGSGNIGATNVARLMGWQYGLIVLVLDMLKGFLCAWGASQYDLEPNISSQTLSLSAGFFATFGHCYSIFLRGKGGKGVATALGATLVVLPVAAGLGIFIWIALAAFFRIAALSSLIAMISVAIVSRLNGNGFEADIYTLALFCLITIRHTSNLKQLKKRWFGESR